MADPYSSRPWAQIYASGQSAARIDGAESMLAAWDDRVRADPDATLIHYFDRHYSYAQINSAADALAAWMSSVGIGKGDRIFVALQNIPEFFISVIAAWKLSAIPVLGNPMYRTAELAVLFADCDPRLIICHANHGDAVNARNRDMLLVTVADESKEASASARTAADFRAILAAHGGVAPHVVKPRSSDTGLLLYTSGTTGVPKGAQLSHANLAYTAELSRSWWGIDSSSRLLSIAPLFHITGFELNLCLPIAAGACVILIGRFEAGVALGAIVKHRPTWTIGAATAFTALVNHQGATADIFASFLDIYSGGAPVPPALVDAFEERLGIRIRTAYGMTETTAPTHAAPRGSLVPVDPASGAMAIGVPMNNVDARILDDAGRHCPVGAPGELIVRGPQVMLGYWNRPEETSKALIDGWMHTGDIAIMDKAGWFYLVDRKKDVIIASGFKVWPREVEDVLYGHPAIREAAVIGVPDEYRGETVKAFVSFKRDAQASESDLIAFCRDRLASYKVPRVIVFLPELPKTPSGKIMRHMLRDSKVFGR
jgi:long-chain acyl-CoA synthetase